MAGLHGQLVTQADEAWAVAGSTNSVGEGQYNGNEYLGTNFVGFDGPYPNPEYRNMLVFDFNSGFDTLATAAVPESSAYAVFCGLAALACLAFRRYACSCRLR